MSSETRPLCFVLLAIVALVVGAMLASAFDITSSISESTIQLPTPLTPLIKSASSPRRAVTRMRSGASSADLLIERVNMFRATYSADQEELPPLKLSSQLNQAAADHAQRMADSGFLAHCDLLDLTTLWSRLTAAGYSYSAAGEIIAAGYQTNQDLYAALTASPGHYQYLLSTEYRELGVGHAIDAGDLPNVLRDRNQDCIADSSGNGPYYDYWALNFGRSDSVYPVVINREAYQTLDNTVELYLYGEGWAVEMRLCNEDGVWTAWLPFSSQVEWQLSPGAGSKQVSVEIRDAAWVTRSASDTIISIEGLDIIFSNGFETGSTLFWSLTEW